MTAATPQPGAVLGIWAHPDDEAYLAGGLMARAADGGRRVVCVTATRGEHGTSDPIVWPPERLAALREHELRASLAVLGVHEHVFLDLEDGTLAALDEAVQVRRLAAIVERVRPTTIVTFGPDGHTGHPDHRTISRWTTAAHRQAAPRAQLLYATCTAERAHRWQDLHDSFDVFLDPELPLRTPASDIAVEVHLDDRELDRKLAALRAQASQTAQLITAIGEDSFRAWTSVESFTEAPSARELDSADAPPRADGMGNPVGEHGYRSPTASDRPGPRIAPHPQRKGNPCPPNSCSQ